MDAVASHPLASQSVADAAQTMIMEQFRTDTDERAVSPVIGVILMVAITVILAAVIGTFVLGLGGQVSQTAPQASITMSDADDNWDENNGNYSAVSISHDGGDSFDASDVEIVVRNTSSDAVVARLSGSFNESLDSGSLNVTYNSETDTFSGKTFATGDTVVIRDLDGSDLSQNQKYQIVIVDQETGQQIASSTVEVE